MGGINGKEEKGEKGQKGDAGRRNGVKWKIYLRKGRREKRTEGVEYENWSKLGEKKKIIKNHKR